MADEIAKLVEALSGDDSLAERFRSDSSLNSGFRKLYSILKYSVTPIADDKSKLGLQAWDLSQIQTVAALAASVVQATRSIAVENVEPVMVAVVQKSVEFALCCLEKLSSDSEDLSIQNNMVQLLEMALVDVVDKEFDLLQTYSSNTLGDLLVSMALEDDHIELEDYVNCKLQGERCLTEQKAADYLLMTLASERLQSDEVMKFSFLGQSLQHECMKMTYVTRHHANFHLECIRRLVFFCSELLGLLNSFDEKIGSINLRKILSLIVRVFKVLGYLLKDNPCVKVDELLLQSFSSFAGIFPKLFGIDFEFITSNAIVESSFESLAIFLMEEFLQLVQTVSLSSTVFHNIRACITASILDHLDSRVWRYNKAAVPKPPLVYFPRVVIYVLKLVMDVKKCGQYVFQLNDFEHVSDSLKTSNPACQVHSLSIFLLKKYSYEELLGIIFPSSSQWVDNLVHLLLFLHSEGIKIRPKFERMGSSVVKATSEPESVSCHEDDALFGDLFSEGGRSFESVDGSDQPVTATAVCSLSNMPSQGAIELLRFLDNVFSPDWSLKVYEDACSKFTCHHMGILLSMINHQGHYSDDRTSDSCTSVLELCFELCKNLLSLQPLSDVVEESLIEKILVIEDGTFTYNDQALSLLAHALISRSGPTGSNLRTKITGLFVEFIVEKAKAVCSSCPSLHDLLESLPSVFHVEILLMAFHLASHDEKVSIVRLVFSSIRTIDSPSPGCGSTQLSCWALLVSRLVLVLRHMLYFPIGCPPSLLLQFKSKLREDPFGRVHRTSQSSWTPIILEKITGVWPKETPANRSLLDQLIDMSATLAAVSGDDSAFDRFSLSWNELLACFSGILDLWRGKQAGNVEDLIVERYMFILCGDISVTEVGLEHAVESLRGLEHPDGIDAGLLLSFRGLILVHSGAVRQKVDFPPVIMGLLHHLHNFCMSDSLGEGGWDFLLGGSWLSLVLCLFDVGILGYCKNSTRPDFPRWGGLISRDAEFTALCESLVSTSFAGNKVPMLLRLFSSLLKKILCAYEKAFLLTFDCGHSSIEGFSPLLLLKQTSFDKSKHNEVCGRMGYGSCQLESFYKLLSNIGEIMGKMVTEHRSRLFWEVSLHGFPCQPQTSSGVLLSCILNIKGIVSVLDGLLKVEEPKGSILMESEVRCQILESVLTIKYDRVFETLHGQCEAIYKSLSSGAEGSDHSSLFLLKNLEGFLCNVNRSGADSSIHECLITNFIDTISDLKRDTSKAPTLQYFLYAKCSSDPSGDFSGAPQSDLLVLIDSLNSCSSESVNIKVINLFVDLLSGDAYLDIKLKLQQKFLGMDSSLLSKWLELRLLGSVLESSSGVLCAKGSSISLRESTMNLVMCLLSSSPAEYNPQELRKHMFEAMLLPLDNAFLHFDAGTAKSYFNCMLQLSRGEMSVRPLLQHTIILMGKLGTDERHLPGLKYMLGFLSSVLSECGSNKKNDGQAGRTVSGSTSGAGSLSSRHLSRNGSDALVLSASQGATAVMDCDATSIDEDEDDGTSDGDVGSSLDKDDEEDNNSEQALASKVCTFTSSGSNFMEQHWYFCYTCDLTVSKGCCSVCAKVCHRGHRVVYSRSSRFFCDCGAGGVRGSSCQCLKPRKFTRGPDSPSHDTGGDLESFLPFTENADQVPESDSDVDEDASVELDHSIKLSLLKEVQDGMPKFLGENDLEDRILKLCSSLLPSIKARRDSTLSRERKIDLGEDKVLSQGTELLHLKKAYKSGSLDLKIKTDYSNSKDLRTHLASGSLVKSLLSVSSRGRLAVGEGDKVAIFDVGQLIGQATSAPVTADKANVKPLSKNVVRFEIVHIIFNPAVDNYLAVAGYEDCQVLTVNHRGEVTDRLAVELALQGAYIRRLEWIPGSQVQLMVVTNKFVKIYDLSQDNFSPVHYFTLPDEMIVDVTLIMASLGRVYLIVLAESGFLYRLELSMKGNAGVKALKETIKVEGRENSSKGLSLHFSSSHKLLIVSYQDGTTLIGRLNSDSTSITEVCSILDHEPDGNLRPAGLHHWKELLEGYGLFFCFSSLKSNAAYVLSIGEREILGQNMRHAVGSTSPLVGITAYKPLSKDKVHCLILHDDGSLQIYSHVPMGIDNNAAAVSEIVKKLGTGILSNKVYGGVKPEFPLDFFEKTMLITPDVKLSGDAIRNGDSEGAKQTLASEDGFLEGPTPSGFKITVSNPNPDIVMVGFRVHVGNTSANHIPSEIKVFQRVIKLDEGMRSWYDIPLTVAESLLADEEFFVSVGPTFGGSALPRIDSLEVYGRAKDEFGWKEKMDAILDMEARMLGSNSWVSGSGRKQRATQTAPLQEQVMADGLKVLSRIYSCKSEDSLNAEEANKELNKLKCKKLLETIFESDREPLLVASACRVLQALFTKKEMYHQVKDTMRLSGVVKSTSILSSKLGTGWNAPGWIIEEFTAQMRAVSKIALNRRSNLAAFLEANGPEVIDGLMRVLWGILDLEHPDTQTMNNIVVSSVELIYSYAECLALNGNESSRHSVTPAVTLFKELLLSTNEAVQTSSSLAISSRLLQVPFPKQTMLVTEDVSENAAPVPVQADVTSATTGSHIMVEEDNITSTVQYCCDGCSTVPILRRRWHCTICPDFDLCEACYEVLDADQLPPPHSRDHPMTAIPIEVESMGNEGSGIHFSSDDFSDPSLIAIPPNTSTQKAPSVHDPEPSESAEFSGSVFDPVTISASKRIVNSLVLSELLKQLKGWMQTTSGVRAIPVMQLFFRLSSATGGPFDEGLEPESIDLEKLVRWFLDEINLNESFAARNRSSFGEVLILVFMFFTLMLRNWNQPGGDGTGQKQNNTVDSSEKSSVQALPIPPVSGSSSVHGQDKSDSVSHLLRACGILRQQTFVTYLMDILQQLVHVFKSSSVNADGSIGLNLGPGCGSLLTIRRELPAGNFGPFFSDAYAKSHRADVFAEFPRLLLENTFRLVYSLIRPEKHDKGGEKDKLSKTSNKDLKLEGYQELLCSYINNPHTTFVRRYARRLFLHLCGSKTHYYSVRDSWQFSNEVKKLYKHVNKSGGFQSTISYERSVKIVKCLSTLAEVAAARPRNWQKYCMKHTDVLTFLTKGVFCFGEECVIQSLKLLCLAFYTGKDANQSLHKAEGGEAVISSNKSGSQPSDSKKKKKGEDGGESGSEKSYLDMEPVVDIFAEKDGETLKQFIDLFLLEWNSSSVRVEAKGVLNGIWHHGNQSFKETMLAVLLQKVKSLPMYGQNIIEYTQLVTSLLGRNSDNSSKQQTSEIVDKCLTSEVIKCIFETLRSQNELLANHPNSRIYNTLSGLVEFDGYYLESDPCVACSSPEVPYSRMKLESLKSETKFTDNRIIVKCTGSYTIQSVTMNVHDARKSKSVKVLNLYYNNRPVADLSELKNNWSLWKRAKTCHLAFNQTELKVDFPIPITACNFMIELEFFYENLQALSLEPLQCPRCSRPVTDKHGICGNCHENAYQCRQCRNINYENLDSFLCNECGYSKYGRFEFNFMAKPSFTFDSMENDEDMKRGLTAIESESENAHRRYQQLLGFKKPLLKIVSSIGENEMDSQQKDSVQQMMVSLPGPSCKINRKIALLGVLYGEKCKAAFDSVSKSVQTLQGLRRVLMKYLHLKHSDTSVSSSRFVVSRSANSCYGCATTFVAQCLEMLQVLSKHPSSRKQLVSAGIMTELFENNIHQGPKTARIQARAALCAFSEGDMNAVAELNSLTQKKVMYCLEHHRSMDIALATREELLLLSDVCSLVDEFWEARLRVAFQLLFSSIKMGAKHPAISEHVILPCLRIVSLACTPPKPDTADKEPVTGKSAQVPQLKDENPSGSGGLVTGNKVGSESLEKNWDSSQKTQDVQLLSYSEWEKGASYLDFVRRQYKLAQAVRSGPRARPNRHDYLALKYVLKWRRRARKSQSDIASFELGSWVTELILSACSQSIRSEMCMLISLLCGQSSSRRYRLLILLMSLLPATLAAGENAAEYFELLFKMMESEDARLFVTVRGGLSTLCKLIAQEVNNIESFERSLHIDISQGFILHKLIELLGKFLEVPNIRSRFIREQLLSEVLEALIVIRGLIVQKTKLICDCNRLLSDLLDSLLLESDENKRHFIQACISGLQIHREERNGRTSLFILEQLCNLICPSKPEAVCLMVLNKAHTQEEFIRGSMTKNPYSSAEIGPLMRDVKNKICHQLDLLGLIEDDYGMELLVAGNIISLDLTVCQVYEQVWKKSNNGQPSNALAGTTLLPTGGSASSRDYPPMTVTYRLQGLDGEATEPMIKELDEDREETQDPEVEFAITGAVRECGGLEVLLAIVQRLRDDLKSNQEQLVAVLNLLMLCCKTRENRRALLRLGALSLLLETARRAFSVDAMEPAEGILLIVESLTLEANESDNISIAPGVATVSTEETGTSEQAKKIVLMFLERLSHPLGAKKSGKQQRNTEMVARILPYLTYGEPTAMDALIEHFEPYLRDWNEFDKLQMQYEENSKDENIAQAANKQKFALENFVRVSESLKTSSCGERLKDIILEKGITGAAVKHLKDIFAFTGQAGFKSSVEWQLGLKLPSVPLILSMLRGLSLGHVGTQTCIDEGGILPLLHALEGVSGENDIGARAENLLDTLCDKEGTGDGFLIEKVHQLRHATRDEMRRRALKKREELLKGMGMRQESSFDGGERIVVAQPVLEGFEDVEEEEDGLACMVCREGYRLRPTDLLGVYTYSKRVNLGVGTSGNARGDCVYTTVSHFNIIHFQCHQEAKRADAALKNPKKEWDGAALRNNETLCNNLFPLRGPSVPVSQYIRYIDQYWDYLSALGRADGSRLRLLTYDIVLMLARFATGASFSADCRGGGKESNSRFLPFMIQMARHFVDHDPSQRQAMDRAISTYLASSTTLEPKASSPGTQSGTEETVQFMMVTSLLSESYESWLQHRPTFLQRGIYHAHMQQTHGRPVNRSPTGLTSNPSTSGSTDELLPVIQPMLVYTGLIEQLQRFFKVKRSSSATAQTQEPSSEAEDESRKLEGWEVLMKERLLNVKEMVGFSVELLSWLDEVTSATDLQEAFDISGVLADVLSGGFTKCEDFVQAAIDTGRG